MAQDGDDRSNIEEQAGYGRPPKQYRVKTGEVRNPWGRKGKPGSKKDFLDEPFEILVDNKRVRVTREEALDHALFNAALKGRQVSAVKELQRRRQERARAATQDATSIALPSEDHAALERYVQRRIQELPPPAHPAHDQGTAKRRRGSSDLSGRQ